MLRFTLAAALVAAVVAPSAANAYTCMPHVFEHHVVVQDQDVTYYTVQLIC